MPPPREATPVRRAPTALSLLEKPHLREAVLAPTVQEGGPPILTPRRRSSQRRRHHCVGSVLWGLLPAAPPAPRGGQGVWTGREAGRTGCWDSREDTSRRRHFRRRLGPSHGSLQATLSAGLGGVWRGEAAAPSWRGIRPPMPHLAPVTATLRVSPHVSQAGLASGCHTSPVLTRASHPAPRSFHVQGRGGQPKTT